MTIQLVDPPGANRDAVLGMLRTICPSADLQVGADGRLRVGDDHACEDAHGACQCVCDLVALQFVVTVRVNNSLAWAYGGVTYPDDKDAGTLQVDGTPGPGTGSNVEIETQNQWEAASADDPDTFIDEPDWLILAHELCGHALHMMRGDELRAPPQPNSLPYPENHLQATAAGAAIRAENGLPPIDQESVRQK